MCLVAIESQAEVGDLQMPVGADKEVVWLDIAMNPFHLVCFLNTEYHFGHILLGDVLF